VKYSSTLKKILQVVFIALFAWSCLIVATLGFMLLEILVIAGKAQIPVTLTAGTGSTATSTDSLTKLTQGSTFVGLQVAMWMFITGCFVCLVLFIKKVIIMIKQRKENKTSGN
jgi:hypothetical protein